MTSHAPDHLLDQTISVTRAVTTTAADGSPQLSWNTHLSSIQARLRPIGPGRGDSDDRQEMRRRWRLYVGRDHDIVATDRITYGSITMRIRDIQDHGTSASVKLIVAEELHL